MKKCVKKCVILFKMWKCVLKEDLPIRALIIFLVEWAWLFTRCPPCKLHHSNGMGLNSENWVRDESGLGFEKSYGERVPPTPRGWTWLDLLENCKSQRRWVKGYVTIRRPTPHMTISQTLINQRNGTPTPIHFFNFLVHFHDSQ